MKRSWTFSLRLSIRLNYTQKLSFCFFVVAVNIVVDDVDVVVVVHGDVIDVVDDVDAVNVVDFVVVIVADVLVVAVHRLGIAIFCWDSGFTFFVYYKLELKFFR